jgi:hypothetical protein
MNDRFYFKIRSCGELHKKFRDRESNTHASHFEQSYNVAVGIFSFDSVSIKIGANILQAI